MLLPPWESVKENGEPYKVFTPFYKQFRTKTVPQVVPRIREDAKFLKIPVSVKCISSDIQSLQLVPEH